MTLSDLSNATWRVAGLVATLSSVGACAPDASPSILTTATLTSADAGHVQPSLVNRPVGMAWKRSADYKLSLLVNVHAGEIGRAQPIFLTAKLRNDSGAPLNVLRPFGDYFNDRACINYVGPNGPLRQYQGHGACGMLGSASYVRLDPGEIASGEIKLDPGIFDGSERPGLYTLSVTYYATRVLHEHAKLWDINDVWIGEITSEPVVVVRR